MSSSARSRPRPAEPRRAGKRPLGSLAAALLCLILLAAPLTGCGDDASPGVYQGYVEAELTYLAPAVGGELATLAVSRGQKVEAGQLVFQLEADPQQAALTEAQKRLDQAQAGLADLQKGARPSEIESLEARLEQARYALSLSKLEYERRSKLRKTGTIPQEDLDRIRANYQSDQARVRQAQAELATARLGARSDRIEAAQAEEAAMRSKVDQARWALEQKTGRATAAGRVFDTFYLPGEQVPAGRPVAALLIPGQVKVRFFVPEPELATVKLGQEVSLSCDSCPSGLIARVSYVSPSAEFTPPVIYSRQTQAKLVFMLEAVPQGDAPDRLHPGQPMEVRLTARQDGS